MVDPARGLEVGDLRWARTRDGCQGAEDHGMLAKASDGYQKNHRIEGRQMRLYTITARILAGLDDERGLADVAGVESSFSEGAIEAKKPIDFNVVTGATPATPKNHIETGINGDSLRKKPTADRGDAITVQSHKCDHCGGFGDTLECTYGLASVRLHRKCKTHGVLSTTNRQTRSTFPNSSTGDASCEHDAAAAVPSF